ncbi:MAG: ubiquinol-cytochrome C chaperone family protein [Pseudomonadota bacterium]
MFNIFSKHDKRINVPEQIYGIVVARARDPQLFIECELPDTVMGRFEVLALHVFLLSRRMKQEGGETAISLSQEVFDQFVADVERALREIGIGDTSVPKRKKKMIRSFYGQIDDFDAHLDGKDRKSLVEKVNARFFEGDNAEMAKRFATYIFTMADGLANIPFVEFKSGKFDWPAINIPESA